MIATLALETEAAPAPMRRPTPVAGLHAWHAAALRGLGPANDGTPRCGWYKRRLVRGGVFVPARIWLVQDICPETGELLSDEVLRCEINGFAADPEEAWTWISGHPVTEQEFRYLAARIDFAIRHEPHDPFAMPSRPIDLNQTPVMF
jgi:hypothetical protein